MGTAETRTPVMGTTETRVPTAGAAKDPAIARPLADRAPTVGPRLLAGRIPTDLLLRLRLLVLTDHLLRLETRLANRQTTTPPTTGNKVMAKTVKTEVPDANDFAPKRQTKSSSSACPKALLGGPGEPTPFTLSCQPLGGTTTQR